MSAVEQLSVVGHDDAGAIDGDESPKPAVPERLSPEQAASRIAVVLDAVDPTMVSGAAGAARAVAALDAAVTRTQSLKLKVLAAADRAGVADESGAADTTAWLSGVTRAAGADAAGQVRLAAALDDGSLPLTSEAVDAGTVSLDHAAIIASTTKRLPDELTPEQRAKVESVLVDTASRVDPTKLRRAAKRALRIAELDADAARRHAGTEQIAEEDRALARTRLTLHDNLDGTVTGHFTVPAFAGQVLRKAIQQLTSPRRGRGAPETPAADTEVDWAHKAGLAFVDVLEHLPTDKLNGKVAATIVVTLDHEALTDELGMATLDTGDDLSAGQVRRLACNAGIVPAVLGGSSLPLDLGRTQRFFTEAQRVALATTYDTCAADGCDRPYAWSELHHEDPWAAGGCEGPTDLHLAVPLCGHHHRRVHDGKYDVTITTDAAGKKCVFFRRRP
ncbi:uncharacterized protein DUF222 [Knoellia remsis]|uniref:Uncharacterized protein DUF222 n=1 Tax=Knoellia remsis TaxID=407159 RepID=A0A2T0UAH5_9MICO|nr:HNH endonuclease signature motif containing protein [Knoellia remsis]PRY54892.1 uncharacterized protein DUF222 [Knoellia remsis]